jgi:hypothetical protein
MADDSQTTGLDRDQLRAVLALARERAAGGAGQSSRDLALLTVLATTACGVETMQLRMPTHAKCVSSYRALIDSS